MKNKKRFIRIIILVLLLSLLSTIMFLALQKAYSLYQGLARKMDYANNLLYTLNDTTLDLRHSVYSEYAHYSFDYEWLNNTPPLVAHAFGGIDNYTYTNSLEAFQLNYDLGHRVFEVDLDITHEDYTVVASHDKDSWLRFANLSHDTPYSHENYMASSLHDRYTTMDYRDVIDLMIAYPDIYIISDTKSTDHTTTLLQFSQIVKYALSTDPTVLNRFIPQIYHEDMLSWIMSVHPFKSVIYTLYMANTTVCRACDFCLESGIRYLTVPEGWLRQEDIERGHQYGITFALHTINNPQKAEQYYQQGIDVLYTDFLLPKAD